MKFSITYILLIIAVSSFSQETDCGNGLDDDGDLLVDCVDPDCLSQPLPSLFSTGSNSTGTGIQAVGQSDLRWEYSFTGPNGTYFPATVIQPYPIYQSSLWANATWIAHNIDGVHTSRNDVIDYYRLKFFLPCTDLNGYQVNSGIVCLYLNAFVDNSIHEIYVNGVPQSSSISSIPDTINPYYACGFCSSGGYSVILCDDWVSGENTINIGIASAPSAIALLAEASFSTSPLSISSVSLNVLDIDNQKVKFFIEGELPVSTQKLILQRGDDDGWKSVKMIDTEENNTQWNIAIEDSPGQSGNWNYRLTIVTSDNQLFYTNIQSISFEMDETITVTPNPSNGEIFISSADNQELDISIFDICGKEIAFFFKYEFGKNNVLLSYKGIVWVRVKTQTRTETYKVMLY